MKLVIDIRPELYEGIKQEQNIWTELELAVLYGTPLPEHYGDLIDRNELFERLKDNCAGRCEFCSSWSVEGCKNILDCTALVKSTEGVD